MKGKYVEFSILGRRAVDISEKTCVKCNVLKGMAEFPVAKNNKDGYNGKCRSCLRQFNLEYRKKNSEKLREQRRVYNEENKERFKDRNKKLRDKNKDSKKDYNKSYQEVNRDKIREQKRAYRAANKDRIKVKQNEYYSQNKDRLKKIAKEYYENNKMQIKQYKRDYTKANREKINKLARNYRNNNINAKIAALTRTRIRETLKLNNARKSNSSIKLLGCTIEFFREYIESKFTKGMSWENHGLYGWHIDHIIPCSSFNLLDTDQQKLCFHYTNTQPLWATKEIALRYGESENYIGNLEKGRG